MRMIAVGSTNSQKIQAVEEACRQLGTPAMVVSCRTVSGRNEQPVGLAETIAGAKQRALAALEAYPGMACIGIESGIIRESEVTLDLAVVALLMPGNRWYFGTSPGIAFPSECVGEAERSGFKTTTVGSVIAKKYGGDPQDPHKTLTHEQTNRMKILIEGVRITLAQVKNAPAQTDKKEGADS